VANTYLVVAHRTLVGDHLVDYCRDLAEKEDCHFHLVVPVRHPSGHAWTDGEIEGIARQRLDEGLAAFRRVGLDVTGEVGDEKPVYAASTALRGLDYDSAGIIVSTLPHHLSHWLRLDVVSKMKREFDLPVTHLVGSGSEADSLV
jgi:GABA permease